MSAPEREEGVARPPRRLARSRLFMLVVAVLLVLGIGVRVAVPPAYRWVKAKRARKAEPLWQPERRRLLPSAESHTPDGFFRANLKTMNCQR